MNKTIDNSSYNNPDSRDYVHAIDNSSYNNPDSRDYVHADIQDSLFAYARNGRPTGGFLRACLENDFLGSVTRASDDNVRCLVGIAILIHNRLPSGCHGSKEKVDRWINEGGAIGMKGKVL